MPSAELIIRQDGKPLSQDNATPEIRFRNGEAYIVVDRPRMYAIVDNRKFGTHTLELAFAPGVAGYAFTFTSCVDPAHSRIEVSA
jgi:hypothetical protein